MILKIDKDKHVLLDANVLIALFNKKDAHHSKALSYIEENGNDMRILIPAHGLFEFNAVIYRTLGILKAPYESFEKGELKVVFDNIHITQELANQARDKGLFDIFSTLRGGDLIYACIAKIHSIPFVTFDNDFKPYEQEIDVKIL